MLEGKFQKHGSPETQDRTNRAQKNFKQQTFIMDFEFDQKRPVMQLGLNATASRKKRTVQDSADMDELFDTNAVLKKARSTLVKTNVSPTITVSTKNKVPERSKSSC